MLTVILMAAACTGERRADRVSSTASDRGRQGTTGNACALTPQRIQADFQPVVLDSASMRITEVTRAAVGPLGDLYVLDGTGPLLLRLDSIGRGRVLLNRRGKGPGELLEAKAFAIAPSGAIAVLTANPSRISLFDSSGHFQRALPYWRAAMAVDAAYDRNGRLYVSYRGMGLGQRLHPGETFPMVEQLTLGDSVVAHTVVALDAETVTGDPYYRAPIIEMYVASSRTNQIAVTGNLFYEVVLVENDSVVRRVQGCDDGLNNRDQLKNSTLLEGGYSIMGAALAYAWDGSLIRLTPAARPGDAAQRLDRWSPAGVLISAWLLPGYKTGAPDFTAVFPTPDPTRYWGYDARGEIYLIRVRTSQPSPE